MAGGWWAARHRARSPWSTSTELVLGVGRGHGPVRWMIVRAVTTPEFTPSRAEKRILKNLL
jgi:hypothetical protein